MKWKVLVSAPYLQPVLDRFLPVFTAQDIEVIAPPVNERFEEADLLPVVGDIDGAICGDDRFTDKVLAAAPRLKVISKWGTGIDSIDQAACKKRGIAVRNTPNAFSEPVADSVLGYMLAFARNLFPMTQQMRDGVWDKIPGKALNECTLGVIGVGDVGKAVVRRAHAFDMKILGNDIKTIPTDFVASMNLEIVGKEQVLEQADFVSLNCDLNSTSHHIISRDELKQMRSDAILINAARGPLVDEKALVWALENGEIAGVALDVFEEEPLPADSKLRSFDNVLMAPHNSNSSPKAWERVHHSTINNCIEELRRGDKKAAA